MFPGVMPFNQQQNDEIGGAQFELKDEKCLFSVIGTGTIRSNSQYKVIAVLHRADKVCSFRITLCGTLYEDSKVVELQPNSCETLIFDVPQLRPGRHDIKVEGLNGISYKNENKLNVLEEKPIILIQTDKATYKPGDLVQFRVLFLDDRTCPYDLERPITIVICDGEQNRLKQWKNIQLTKGVYSGKYQLSEQPVLGKWKIDVIAEGQSLELKNFEVDKYVLPKFNVKIETANDVAITDGIIKVTVRSKYTYGKNVKGKAVVTLKNAAFGCFGSSMNWAQIEKTIEVDGKGEAEFKLADDLGIQENCGMAYKLEVLAVMEEELTGNKQEAKETINLHLQRFKIREFDTKFVYESGKVWTANIAIKHVDDTPAPADIKNPVKLLIEKQQNHLFGQQNLSMPMPMPQLFAPAATPINQEVDNAKSETIELTATLNEQGIATFQHTFAEDNDNLYSIKVIYQDCKAHLFTLTKKPMKQDTKDLLKITVPTTDAQIAEKVEVVIESCEDIPYFIYTLMGRGKILKSEMIIMEENKKQHTIDFVPTFEMVPEVAIFVHFIVNNKLRFEERKISVKQEFQNKISINAPAQAKPSEEIALEIETAQDSFVGLLGVDQSVLLLRAGNDLEANTVINKLGYYTSTSKRKSLFGAGRCPGELSGLIMLGNIWVPPPAPRFRAYGGGGMARGGGGGMLFGAAPMNMQQAAMAFSGPPPGAVGFCAANTRQFMLMQTQPVIEIRKEFPENWIFEDIENTDKNKIILHKKVPDTITSWVLTGFAVNPVTGLAITKEPTLVKTFRPFFIGTNLPYSIKRGEIVTIPVLIFNYMDQELDAEITFDNADSEFEFAEPGDGQLKRLKHLKVAANNGANVNFKICPKTIGEITLKITAVSALAGDAIHKKLKVEAEGITVYKNRDYYLHVESGLHNTENAVKLDIPKDLVADSEFIEVSLMGNILGSTITNIDKLVRMPYGCGEQNMINFVPNILVLWYLESIHELSPSIESKAKHFLEIGYQRELTYKHDDGSYSAFGKSDNSGSTWLTAYVMRSFHQARKYIDISDKILGDGLNFLAKTQMANGAFKEVGRVVDFSHMNELGLTAFVLLAFLENHEVVDKHKAVIDRGFEYLQQNVRNSDDLYALSIALYTLQQRKLPVVHDLLAKLEALARIDGGHKWWTKAATDNNPEQSWRPSSHDVEITGYILMTLLDMNVSVMPITRWLISQRNSNGGFSSTQETVVGLWALIKFAEKSGAANPDMCVEVDTKVETSKRKLHVNHDNAMVVQKVELPKQTRDIAFRSNGTGTAIFQLSYKYNILAKESKPSFKLNTKVKLEKKLSLSVSAEFTPTSGEQSSNMVVMEVAMPSGFTALKEKVDKINKIKRIETKHEDTVLMVYFEKLEISQPRTIFIEAQPTHEVSGQKPAAITIYDYYDNKKSATDFYQI